MSSLPLVELKQLDGVLRHEVEVITRAKVCSDEPRMGIVDGADNLIQNDYTEQCIGTLRRISALNVDLVQLPTTLSQLQAKFRTKTNFSHIQRLHNMLYSYGATVIEIVRRKEFCEHLKSDLSSFHSLPNSTILLSTSTIHSGSYGQTLVSERILSAVTRDNSVL